MASSNVDYYKRQKELQDIIHENEHRRANLDAKLKVLCKSDNRLAKLQTARLRTYWKRLTDDQKKAQQRNKQIVQEFERIDQHLASSVARTEKLRLLKRQYEEYIERAFPVWMDKVMQIKQQRQQEEDLIQQQQHEYQQQQTQRLIQQQLQQEEAERIRQASLIEHDTSPYQNQQRYSSQESPLLEPPRVYMDVKKEQLPERSHNVVTSTPFIKRNSKENMAMESRNEPETIQHIPQLDSHHPRHELSDGHQAVVEHDVSVSEEVPDEMMSQPIQSIIVERIGQKRTGPPSQVQESPDVSKSLSGPMAPDEDDDDDEDNFSEFDDDDVDDGGLLPDNQEQSNQQRRTIIPVPPVDSEQSSLEESPMPSPGKAANKMTSGTPEPDLSVDGLMRLISFVQDDFPQALSLEGYYRSHRPSAAERMTILQKANRGEDLSGLDAEKVSMVVLEQTTLVVRSVCHCVLSESLLATIDNDTIHSEAQIRPTLTEEAKPLWNCLFKHIMELVKQKVMLSKEAAAVFVPCLVSENSPYQDKAYNLLISLIEKSTDDKTGIEASPRDTLDSRSSLGGGIIGADGKIQVPPLKFGSLVESKQFSDEESTTMMTPSVPTDGPKVPLNETAAYRSLLTGTIQQKQPMIHADDDDSDNTDDDVEKQFASTLSPRDPPRFDKPPQVEMEPLSEASSTSHQINQDQIPTAVQLQSTKSAPGTTPASQPLRKPGIQFSSDLDTDTEIDLPLGRKSQELDKDDDFDFYG